MIYFKDLAGEVFAYDSAEERHEFGKAELVPMTATEVEVHLNPPAPLPNTSEIDAARDERLAGGIEFQGTLFQSRPIDRERITEAAQLAFMAAASGAKPGDLRWLEPEQDFTWIAADNTLVPMDAPTVVAFAKAMAARTQALVLAGRRLKDMDAIPGDYTDDKWWP